jgi:bifunctional DNase/RNase
MSVKMRVKGLTFDPKSQMFVVVLTDLENVFALPIWIGPFEASAIALKLRNISTYRPQTHDIIQNTLEALEARIVKVEVMDLRGNTYFALLYIMAGGKEITVDSRPSDAIALALRADAPIYVEEKILSKAKKIELGQHMDKDELAEFLKSLNPEDFKYKA